MKAAVISFPGSNCDRDMATALDLIDGVTVTKVWHKDANLPDHIDLIALPGGFSYGDYLRCGAMSANSPIMKDVVRRAKAGVAVLGVCNGFQVLTEAGLLPGALMRNAGLSFVCEDTRLTVANTETRFTSGYSDGAEITIPVAHHDGNYFADAGTLERLEGEGQILFRYGSDINGSQRSIAGIINDAGTVMGMMPHPERAVDPETGLTHGRPLFESLLQSFH